MKARESQLVIHTAKGISVLFGSILGAELLGSLFVAIFKEHDFWLLTVLSAPVVAAFFAWFATTRLELTADAIHYRSLLVSKCVALSDVVNAEFAAGLRPNRPYQRLLITARDGDGEREVTINLGLFARPDIKQWMDALNERL